MGFDKSADNYLNSSDHKEGTDLVHFKEFFENARFKRVLDVACAAGHFANAIDADVKIITDLSHNMLRKASEAYGLENSSVSRAEYLPFLDESFDIVGCRIAMHHFQNPCMFMSEIYRILEVGGYFVLIDSVVDEDDEELNRLEALRDMSHLRSHTIEDIIAVAYEEKLIMEEFMVFSKTHDFKEWVSRLNQSEDVCRMVEDEFLKLSDSYKDKYRLVVNGGRVISYTDKKALFIFRK